MDVKTSARTIEDAIGLLDVGGNGSKDIEKHPERRAKAVWCH